jgi:hypothetical protein
LILMNDTDELSVFEASRVLGWRSSRVLKAIRTGKLKAARNPATGFYRIKRNVVAEALIVNSENPQVAALLFAAKAYNAKAGASAPEEADDEDIHNPFPHIVQALAAASGLTPGQVRGEESVSKNEEAALSHLIGVMVDALEESSHTAEKGPSAFQRLTKGYRAARRR